MLFLWAYQISINKRDGALNHFISHINIYSDGAAKKTEVRYIQILLRRISAIINLCTKSKASDALKNAPLYIEYVKVNSFQEKVITIFSYGWFGEETSPKTSIISHRSSSVPLKKDCEHSND
jgi:hypothetical protein